MDDFTEWLREEMRIRGLRQSDLVNAGVNSGMASQVYNGIKRPGRDTCIKIAKAMGVPSRVVMRHAGLMPEDESHDIDEVTQEVVAVMRRVSAQKRREILRYALFAELNPDLGNEANQKNHTASDDGRSERLRRTGEETRRSGTKRIQAAGV